MTDAQAEKWLGARFSREAALAFTETFELELRGDLDVAALQEALDAVALRHEALAVHFDADGSTQIHSPPGRLPLRHLDFSQLADPWHEYRQACFELAAVPFDPTVPPLIRLSLCRLGPDHHCLYGVMHHLVVDGWSVRVIVQEAAALYNAHRRGVPARLPPADSWAAYVHRENQRRRGAEGQRSLEYWLGQYRELPEPLRLPTDHPRGPRIAFASQRSIHRLSADMWRSLRHAGREHGVSRICMLMAGYFALMHRLTGQTDLVCGVPFVGAVQGGGARMVGDTGNTLPIRVRVEPEQSLLSLARQVQQAMAEAGEHQDVSLGRIVESLQLPREPGRMLLVEHVVTLAPSAQRVALDGIKVHADVPPRPASAWELGFYWREMPGEVLLDVQYQTALFDADSIADWAQAYLDIIALLATGGQDAVGSLRIPAQDDARSFSLVNPAAAAGAEAPSLPALLEPVFAANGSRRAVHCRGQSLSYQQLEQRSSAIAHNLLAAGLGPGALVAVALPRSVDMLAVTLGIMRAGMAYLPLDLSFPEQRLQRMAEHSGTGHVVVEHPGQLPASLLQDRRILQLSELTAPAPATALPAVGPEQLAYVLYTSGSTGDPKGVCILQRNLVNFLCAMRERPGFGADDIICAATTLSFDIAALELYLPLLCGGCVVIADDDQHRDPQALCTLIEEQRCTLLQTTPSLIALLQEVGRVEVLQPLRLLLGGEALPLPLAMGLLPHCRELWNMYGPTETTVWSSVQRMTAAMPSVPLGQPIARTAFYLLDEQRQPAFPHALGEIWIGGDGVADGYLHQPDLSAERFVPDPFADDGSRMYRTGDLGRIQAGQLHFHGRADQQIKLRGYRIEPGDIEAVAAAEPEVSECVAVCQSLPGGDQVLVLHVASSAAPAELTASLRERLRIALPAYMRPHYVMVSHSLPKTPNGKIDRRSLPAPTLDEELLPARRLVPRSPTEALLQQQWSRLLQRPEVGITHDFFELGGHSLLAVRMFTELQQQLGVDLPLAILIEHPTIASLGAVIDGMLTDAERAGTSQAAVDGWRSLVVLRQGDDSRPPLFLFHAVGGNVLNYLPLLQALPPTQTVYGVQSCGLDGSREPLRSIDAMAWTYGQELLQAWPHGPFLLGGGSMGGVLALEVARMLQRHGRQVALLAMLDTYGPRADGRQPLLRVRLRRSWHWLRQLDARQSRTLWQRLRVRFWTLPAWRLRQALVSAPGPMPQAARIRLVERGNFDALAGYVAAPLQVPAILFRTRIGKDEEPSMGWQRWLGPSLRIIELPGKHDDFIDQPALAVALAAQLEQSLSVAQGADPR
ncbi:non-ribosomal peptide synthetase [Pseudoxanthomonas dokdonensis]|uniref:non-ribosomal peptide synthetase n=1 Tax=Pseudoxanthomonas dokdonensis TaxID=344882 RepID=UPI0007101A11|nr:non-ribosomal peptide synthetase [Pseudoxanthomonas dokdonensis]